MKEDDHVLFAICRLSYCEKALTAQFLSQFFATGLLVCQL